MELSKSKGVLVEICQAFQVTDKEDYVPKFMNVHRYFLYNMPPLWLTVQSLLEFLSINGGIHAGHCFL